MRARLARLKSPAHGGCGNGEERRRLLLEYEILPGEEKEDLIALDGSAEIRAVLVLSELGPRQPAQVVEERVRVDDFVAQKFVGRAVERIRSGLAGQVLRRSARTRRSRR